MNKQINENCFLLFTDEKYLENHLENIIYEITQKPFLEDDEITALNIKLKKLDIKNDMIEKIKKLKL